MVIHPPVPRRRC